MNIDGGFKLFGKKIIDNFTNKKNFILKSNIIKKTSSEFKQLFKEGNRDEIINKINKLHEKYINKRTRLQKNN